MAPGLTPGEWKLDVASDPPRFQIIAPSGCVADGIFRRGDAALLSIAPLLLMSTAKLLTRIYEGRVSDPAVLEVADLVQRVCHLAMDGGPE